MVGKSGGPLVAAGHDRGGHGCIEDAGHRNALAMMLEWPFWRHFRVHEVKFSMPRSAFSTPGHPTRAAVCVRALRCAKRGLGAALLAAGLGLSISGCMLYQPLLSKQAVPVVPESLRADPERLQTHVRALSETFFPRSFDQPLQLQAAADYIVQQLTDMGHAPERQSFVVQDQRVENIVLRLGPAPAPETAAQPLLVLGAHYDSVHTHDVQGVQGVPTPHTHTPGADDNASGVAGLLELARLLKAQPPTQPLELVFYTLEEPPHFRTEFMGSHQHAQQLQASGVPVRLMLSVEMIGYFSDAPGSQQYPLAPLGWIYPERGNFLALIGELKNFAALRHTKAVMQAADTLPVYSLNAPRWVHGVDFSDHLNYWHFGMPAIMVTDTSFMRNAHYHQSTDTWQTLDFRRMAQVVRMLAAVALDAGD